MFQIRRMGGKSPGREPASKMHICEALAEEVIAMTGVVPTSARHKSSEGPE